MNFLLIGRPNVGKSSIYNLFSGTDLNIVHSDAGTTRDWHETIIEGTKSLIFDTPGVLINENNDKIFNFSFNEIVKNKINIFLYVLEYKNGFNNIDHFAIKNLRKYNKKIILVVNKYDNYKKTKSTSFLKYGIEDIIFISCSHLYGTNELKTKIKLFSQETVNIKSQNFSIAIFGKPNVGKSTFLNTILGYERAITSPISGTTSDFITDSFIFKKKHFKIIDTAGIGKKAKVIKKSINYYSIKKSFEKIIKVDASIILIDSNEGIDRQDKRIIKLISHKSKSIILVFNKIDLIKNLKNFKSNIISETNYSLNEVKNIKIFFISAFEKKYINKILNYIYSSIYQINYKFSTSHLNQWLKNITKENKHPLIENKKINFKYAVQIKNKPVTIKIFCNYASKLKNNYKKFLINNFNRNFKIKNQKTKFVFSSSKNPYI